MSQEKAPNLFNKCVQDVLDYGIVDTAEQAEEYVSLTTTKEVVSEIRRLAQAGYKRKSALDTPISTCYVKTDSEGNETNVKQVINKGNKDMALKCTVGSNGNYEKIERKDYGSGLGVEAARPLPTVAKQEPTKVEQAPAPATASVQKQTEPTAQQPQAELLHDYNKLPSGLQRLIDDISLHKLPTTEALPVLHIVGFNQDTNRFIFKCVQGQASLNAYGWLYLTNAKQWENVGCVVVAPTDVKLLKIWNGVCPNKYQPAQADYMLIHSSDLHDCITFDFSTAAVVVAAPASEPKVSAKVKAKVNKPEQQDEPKQAPAITEEAIAELLTTTNLMSLRSKTNKISEALGLTKLDSKTKKADVQARVQQIQALLNIPAPAADEKPAKAAKEKATKAPKVKAPTKAEVEDFYVADLMRETACTKAQAKLQFKALDVKWTSSVERTTFAQSLGMTLATA